MDETPMTPPMPPDETGQTQGPGLVSRVFGVFFSPRKAFAPQVPKLAWILPLVILAAVQSVDGYLLRDMNMERAEQRLLEADMPADARERALEALEGQKERGPESIAIGFVGSAIFIFLAGFLLPSLLYWVGANFVVGGSGAYWSIVSVVGLSHLVFVVRSILTTPLKLAKNSLDVFTSLALLPVAEAGSKLSNALNVFDIFDIWYIVVASFGLSMVARIRHGQALGIVILLWAVWALIRVGLAFVATGTMWGAIFGL
jgi:hypothetical protein